jgi:hypothetical protein
MIGPNKGGAMWRYLRAVQKGWRVARSYWMITGVIGRSLRRDMAWGSGGEWRLHEGHWYGPNGEKIKAISGGQFDDGGFGGLISGAVDAFGAGAPDVSSYVPTDASAAAPSGTGGGWFDTFSKYAGQALPFVRGAVGLAQIPLGIKAMQDASAARNTLNQSVKQAQTVAQPAATAASQLIPAGAGAELGGPLPPQAEADVQAKVNAFKTQKLQQLTSQGMDPASAQAQIAAEVGQYEQQLRQAWADHLLQGGTAATAAALGGTGQAAGIAGSQQATTDTALAGANEALMRLLGAQG